MGVEPIAVHTIGLSSSLSLPPQSTSASAFIPEGESEREKEEGERDLEKAKKFMIGIKLSRDPP